MRGYVINYYTKMMNYYCKRFLWVLVLSFLLNGYQFNINKLCVLAAPTDGFRQVSLSQSNFQLHKPYDQATQNRYSNSNGVERFWVYSNDKPFKQDSQTKPRTEMRISVCICFFSILPSPWCKYTLNYIHTYI